MDGVEEGNVSAVCKRVKVRVRCKGESGESEHVR